MGTFCEQIQLRHRSTAAQATKFMGPPSGSVKNREAAAEHIEDFMDAACRTCKGVRRQAGRRRGRE